MQNSITGNAEFEGWEQNFSRPYKAYNCNISHQRLILILREVKTISIERLIRNSHACLLARNLIKLIG